MTDEFREWFKNIGERLSDPFLFATALSWCLANWKFFVVLLHEGMEGEAHSEIIREAGEQLGDPIEAAAKLAGAVLVGYLYAREYPRLSAWFRLKRWTIQQELIADTEIAEATAKSRKLLGSSKAEVFTREQWHNGAEHQKALAGLEAGPKALIAMITDVCPNPTKNPYLTVAHLKYGDLEPGFAVLNGNDVMKLPPHIDDTSSLVYVVCSVRETNRAVVAVPGAVFPVMNGNKRPKYEWLMTHDGVRHGGQLDENCLGYVEIHDDKKWATFLVKPRQK